MTFRVLSPLLCSALILVSAAGAGRSADAQKRGMRNGQAAQVRHAEVSDRSSGTPVSFREEIEPLLKAKCGSCHSSDKHMGGLVVETPEALLKGGAKSGSRIVVPGKPAESALLAYLTGKTRPRMPFNSAPLAGHEIKSLENWINQGAKVDAPRLSWPYVKPAAPAVPTVRNTAWIRNPIDAFILTKLEAAHLKPAPVAGKVALLRRVYADLLGVPPSPREADSFLQDSSPEAFPKLVDRLLSDPRYGERWARHWLDLVRFAETHGFENDGIRAHAWRYRDYVIRSFNADKPYDRFLKEQIAGDELYPDDPEALVATGFARLGPWDELSTDGPQRWQDYLNDATDTTGSVVLGLTVGCARCHNHKYDPITQADYYRFQSFFAQTRRIETRLPGNVETVEVPPDIREGQIRLKPLREELDQLKSRFKEIAALRKRKKNSEKVEVNDDEIDAAMEKQDRERRRKLEDEVRRLEALVRPFDPSAEVIADSGKEAPKSFVLLRGNLHTPGPEVKPGYPAALCGGQEIIADAKPPAGGRSTGRRTALANWITARDNPMTARVMVNRLWQHHFGRGVVGTPSDFGRNGDRPTHPELLDWLAQRFVEEGWSLKKMHRLMLLSSTYQMSTQTVAAAEKVDPMNTLFWRMNRIRLEGEALRDSILTVSGRMNPARYGPSVYPKVSDEVLSTGSTHKWGSSPEAEGLRRSIYVFQRRSLLLPLVEVFDAADMTNTCPRRAQTTIAPQALALFNGEFARTEARWTAERVRREAGEDRGRQIDQAYRLILIRNPSVAQKELARAFLEEHTERHLKQDAGTAASARATAGSGSSPPADAKAQSAAALASLADFCHVLINANEFIYLD